MTNNFLQNDARAIMIYNIINLIKKLDLFKNKKSIINIGSFDLIASENIELAMQLLSALKLDTNGINLSSYIDKRRISSEILWKKLGFEEINFIDPDGAHNSLTYDFNLDIQEEIGFMNSFEVVANFGTLEHIFNQYAAFKNIHKLCNVDGLMIHSLPIQGAFEHGMYNYHPNFFYALASANGYKIEYFGLRHKNLKNYNLVEINNDAIKPFLNTINALDTLGALVIFRKLADKEFKVPFQGRYESFEKNTT